MARKSTTRRQPRRRGRRPARKRRQTGGARRFLVRTLRRALGYSLVIAALWVAWEGLTVYREFEGRRWSLPARVYANEGIAQVLFFESDEECETSYADRQGKYQGQRGVTLPKA